MNIVIADSDSSYLDGLANYLIDNHSNRFQVHSFTKKDFFQAYVEKNPTIIDIILVCPEMYFLGLEKLGIKLLCILSDGKLPMQYEHCEVISKYQLADSLASHLIHMYTQKTNIIIMQKGKNKSRVISIYSPLPGSGKTSIAYGLALKAASEGKKVFYLNIEDNATTDLFLDTDGAEDLSHILFYLKAKIKNLSTRMDLVKKEDKTTGIHYFSPPKSNLELDEIIADEYINLITELRTMGNYDFILLDMHSGFNSKIASVLGESDNIVFVVTDEITLKVKTAGIVKDFEILYNREKINIYNKLLIVQNKFKSGNSIIGSFSIGQNNISLNIPFDENILIQNNENNEKCTLNLSGIFGESLEELLRKLA